MTINAGDLLRALGGGFLPPASAQGARPVGASQTLDFAALLKSAQGGELRSGRPLQVDNSVQAEFTPSQLARLGSVADAADAAGARKLLAILDGQGVVIDIASRTIERVVPLDGEGAGSVTPGDVLVGVDSAVIVPTGEVASAAGGATMSPLIAGADASGGAPGRIENGSLLERLASQAGALNVFFSK